jgi:hypothetical protein
MQEDTPISTGPDYKFIDWLIENIKRAKEWTAENDPGTLTFAVFAARMTALEEVYFELKRRYQPHSPRCYCGGKGWVKIPPDYIKGPCEWYPGGKYSR